MAYSEIFDNYIKIALEKGIIKNAEETNPRFDSRTVKEIEKLYDLKIDRPEDMEYEHNIVEDAHPEPVVLFQSHDKMNSLVENINERQNIIVNILKKMPNGNLIQKKYAEDLAMTLIRIATDLDNKNQTELMVLADTCAEQLSKKADWKDDIKGWWDDAKDMSGAAITGGILGGLAGAFLGPEGAVLGTMGGAALGGAALTAITSYFVKTSPVAKSVVVNAKIAEEQVNKLLGDHPQDVVLQTLITNLTHIQSTASNYSQVVDKLHVSPNSHDASDVESIATRYKDELKKLKDVTDLFLSNADSGKYAIDESDLAAKFRNISDSIVGSTLHDAVGAVKVLQEEITKAQTSIAHAQIEAQNQISTYEPDSTSNIPTSYQPASTSKLDFSKFSPEQINQLMKEYEKYQKVNYK